MEIKDERTSLLTHSDLHSVVRSGYNAIGQRGVFDGVFVQIADSEDDEESEVSELVETVVESEGVVEKNERESHIEADHARKEMTNVLHLADNDSNMRKDSLT